MLTRLVWGSGSGGTLISKTLKGGGFTSLHVPGKFIKSFHVPKIINHHSILGQESTPAIEGYSQRHLQSSFEVFYPSS